MFGRVTFPIDPEESPETAVATLGDDGRWTCSDFPNTVKMLNRMLALRLDDAGPADGDPMVAAVIQAAKLLKGSYELEPKPAPEGRIY